MPYKSLAQERWAHSPSGKKALGAAGVKEWDNATRGKKLPERVSSTNGRPSGHPKAHQVGKR